MHPVKLLPVALSMILATLAPLAAAQTTPPLGFVTKLGIDVDVRSGGRILRDESPLGKVTLPDAASPIGGGSTVPQIQLRGGNVQVNVNPNFDYVQIFEGFRPFLHFTQSEVSAAASSRNIVVTYNNSAGIQLSPNPPVQVWYSPGCSCLATRCPTTAVRLGAVTSSRPPRAPPRPSAIRR